MGSYFFEVTTKLYCVIRQVAILQNSFTADSQTVDRPHNPAHNLESKEIRAANSSANMALLVAEKTECHWRFSHNIE